jgi:hypothetical protein
MKGKARWAIIQCKTVFHIFCHIKNNFIFAPFYIQSFHNKKNNSGVRKQRQKNGKRLQQTH